MTKIKQFLSNIYNFVWNKNNLSRSIFIISVVSFLILLLIDICVHKAHPLTSNYACNIATEFCGIAITYYFIQKLFDKHNIEKAKKEEFAQILRHNEIISIYLDYYKRYFYCITTPNEKRDFKNMNFNRDFKLKDMCDLYKSSLLLSVSLFKPSIELFYEYEQALRNTFKDIINSIDFKYHPEIQELLTAFIKVSLMYNVSDAIIANKEINIGNIKATDDANTMLQADYIEEHYVKFKQNKLPSNAAIPYFILYDLLKIEQRLIIDYETLINELKSKTN